MNQVTTSRKEDELFVAAWFECGFNATKAYQKLHPEVVYGSARVMGSRQLTKVNISKLLQDHELNLDTYLRALRDGLEAVKDDGKTPDYEVRLQYLQVLGKLLNIR